MNQQRKFWIKQLRDLVLLMLAGFLMTFLFYHQSRKSLPIYILISFYTASMWIFLWKGNDLLNHVISNYISWIKEPLKRFSVGIIGTVIYSAGIVYLLVFLFESFTSLSFGSGVNGMVAVSLVITIIISLFLHGREFFLNWKQTLVKAEQLERENIQAQYDNLKSQVNPHFLFNSLNALTNLVYEDQDKAAKFIKQLSTVYRYVLETRDKEIVTLAEELKFLDAYLFLQQIRFDKNLRVSIEINNVETSVAPLSIQMLFENAIKHNVISNDQPLKISLFTEGNYLVIKNSLQPKDVASEESNGMGLENIVKRYSFLSDMKVRIDQDENYFQVRVPFITKESIVK